jgi:hypothetical protein
MAGETTWPPPAEKRKKKIDINLKKKKTNFQNQISSLKPLAQPT